MKLPFALALALSTAVHAGSINLVNLVSRDTTRFTFTQGAGKETFELPAGSSSGKFQSAADTVIRCLDVPGAETTVVAKDGDFFVVFHETSGKPEWRILPAKPSEGVLALRLLNLGPDAVTVKISGKEIPLETDAVHELEKPEGRKVTAHVVGSDASETFDPAEPSAGLAILFKKTDAWHITLVPDI